MHEILTTEQMADADRRAVAYGVASLSLMETAGRAVATEAGQMLQPGGRVLVLCGPGNNGGDGFVAARYLKQRGFEVRVACLVAVSDLKGDAAAMAAKWTPLGTVEHFPDDDAAASRAATWPDLVIDAVFGAGFQRTLPPTVTRLFGTLLSARAAGRGVLKLAIDVPSGVIGNTGETPDADSMVLPADVTVTFQRMKPAHVTGSGKYLCGRVVLADIGIPAEAIADIDATRTPRLSVNDPAHWLTCVQRFETLNARHKYVNGHAVVVSGPAQRTGAARLAARAALRAGAGLVTLLSRPEALAINAAHTTAVMVDAIDGAAGLSARLADKRINVVVIGPGLGTGETERALVAAALNASESGRTWVLDADALSIVARDPSLLFDKAQRQPSDGWNHPRFVLTPHEGEFERLFGKAKPGQSKIDRTLDAAARSQCVVVFKGADTVIACPERETASGRLPAHAIVNTNAPSHLATAGTGDVLAGLIAGVLAHNPASSAFEAACAGVWMHGAGATLFGPGLIADDLPETMPRVLNDLARRWIAYRRSEDAKLRATTRSS